MTAITHTEFGPPDVLALSSVPKPSPGPAEVLIRVEAAGVNPIDVQSRAGQGFTSLLGAPPYIPGWDVSGVVEAVGYGVTNFSPGDHVQGMPHFPKSARTYAEYVTSPSRQVAQKPDNISFVEAAAIPLAATTAVQVLSDVGRLDNNRTVLVHGASGGVGHVAVQVAASIGCRVIATARLGRSDWLRELGATEVFDLREAAAPAELLDEVDLAVDLVGDGLQAKQILENMRSCAKFVGVADSASEELRALAHQRGIEAVDYLVEPDSRSLEMVRSLVASGSLRVRVERTYQLAEAIEAHFLQEAGHVAGKLVLQVGSK